MLPKEASPCPGAVFGDALHIFIAPLREELQPWVRLCQHLNRACPGIPEGSAVYQRAGLTRKFGEPQEEVKESPVKSLPFKEPTLELAN